MKSTVVSAVLLLRFIQYIFSLPEPLTLTLVTAAPKNWSDTHTGEAAAAAAEADATFASRCSCAAALTWLRCAALRESP